MTDFRDSGAYQLIWFCIGGLAGAVIALAVKVASL